MYTHISIPTTFAAAEQPGTVVTVENNGLIRVAARFVFSESTFQSVILPSLGRVAHPRYTMTQQEGDAICTEGEGGLVEVAITFMGTASNLEFNGDDPETQVQDPPVFSMGRASESEPIFTNPAYESLTPEDKKEVRDAIFANAGTPGEYATWPDAKKKLYDKLASGIDSWRAPRVTWTVEYATNRPINTAIARRQGTICAPWGPAPGLGDGRNWLFDQMEEVRQGSAQRIRLVWLASGPGGWDSDHYSPPT